MIKVNLTKGEYTATMSWYQSFDENPTPTLYSIKITSSDIPSIAMKETEPKSPFDAFVELLKTHPNIKLTIEPLKLA